MRAVVFRLIGVIVLMLVTASVVGWLFGFRSAVFAASAVALAVVAVDTRGQVRLLHWLKEPSIGDVPHARGIWGEVFYRVARQLRQLEAQVEHEQDKLKRFIEALQASPNGLILMDRADQIDWCNDTAARHFGLDMQRDLRQHAVHLIRNPEFFAYMAAKRFDTPLLMRRTGDFGQILLSVQIIPYGEGQKLMLSRDVTQFERVEAMRRDFVANVSHEIKTPLTVIAGFVESLRGLEFSAEEREHILSLMQEQSDRMRHLVEDLLTLAHLEGDPHQPVEEVLDMRRMVERLSEDARALSGGRHRIEVTADDANLRGARVELVSAFTNLVSNAVRYTPAGGEVRISWRVSETDSEGPRGEFSVADSGIGIPADHIPRLTERFYRVDRGRSRETGGTGLGLAIVKQVLLRHQAELRIASQVGKGSVFTVRFPPSRLVLRDKSLQPAAIESGATP